MSDAHNLAALDALADDRLDELIDDAAWATLCATHGDALMQAITRAQQRRAAIFALPRPALPVAVASALTTQRASAPTPPPLRLWTWILASGAAAAAVVFAVSALLPTPRDTAPETPVVAAAQPRPAASPIANGDALDTRGGIAGESLCRSSESTVAAKDLGVAGGLAASNAVAGGRDQSDGDKSDARADDDRIVTRNAAPVLAPAAADVASAAPSEASRCTLQSAAPTSVPPPASAPSLADAEEPPTLLLAFATVPEPQQPSSPRQQPEAQAVDKTTAEPKEKRKAETADTTKKLAPIAGAAAADRTPNSGAPPESPAVSAAAAKPAAPLAEETLKKSTTPVDATTAALPLHLLLTLPPMDGRRAPVVIEGLRTDGTVAWIQPVAEPGGPLSLPAPPTEVYALRARSGVQVSALLLLKPTHAAETEAAAAPTRPSP